MTRKSIHQRYLSIPYGVFGSILAIVFGAIAVEAWIHPEDGPSIRMVIPMYLFSVYWVIVSLCNIRTAILTPHHVRDIVWPFPVHLPRLTNRTNIRHCFIRGVTITDEDAILETYNMVGVETLAGLQIDLSGPHATLDQATTAATEVANILKLEIVHVSQTPTRRELVSRLLRLAFWATIGFSSLYLGFVWEENFQRSKHISRNCDIVLACDAPSSRSSSA